MAATLRKIILLVVFITSIGQSLKCTVQQTEIHNKYTKKFFQFFNAGDFSHGLFYLYNLVHIYNNKQDSAGLYITWSRIAVLNYLSDKYYHGNASVSMANMFRPASRKDYYYLFSACKEKDKNPEKAIQYLKFIKSNDPFIVKVSMYLELHLEFKKFSNGYIFIKAVYDKSKKLIKQMENSADTAWFGYAYVNYQIGFMEYFNVQFGSSFNYLVKSIKIYEQLGLYSYEWLDSYILVFFLNEKTSRVHYFNRINELYAKGFIKKSLLPYYFSVKSLHYFMNANGEEAKDAILEAINNSTEQSTDMKSVIHFLLHNNFILEKYSIVIEWFEKYRNTITNPYYLGIVATSYLRTGNRIEADNNIRKSVEALKKWNNKINFTSYKIIANYYLETGDLKNAESCYKKYALLAMEAHGARSFNLAGAYESLAYFYWVKGDIKKSMTYYQKEICILVQVPYNNNFFQPPADISKSMGDFLLTSALRNQADVFFEASKLIKIHTEKRKYLETSLVFFELALKVATRYKISLYREDKKLHHTDILNRIYSKLNEVCFDLYKETHEEHYSYKAFEYAEKSKASLLLSMVRGADARKLSMIPNTVAEKEDYLGKTTDYYLKLIADENQKTSPNLSLIEKCNTELQFTKQKQDSLIENIRINYPQYYNTRFNTEVISVDSLKKKLLPSQVIVLYSLTNNYLSTFLISATNFKTWHQKIDLSFFNTITKYRNFISDYSYGALSDSAIRSFVANSYNLYTFLLQPLEKFTANKEIIIIPDGDLNTIPFEPLITDSIKYQRGIGFKDMPYLLKKNTIIYNFSSTLFAYTCNTSLPTYSNARLLAIAPSDVNIELSEEKADKKDTKGENSMLFSIPGSINEVKGIHTIFPGKLILKENATESNFLKHANRFSILHLASHGIVNDEYPLFSKLVFSQEKDTINDGYLNTYEIYNTRMSAPLVVLSACNSGFGKIYKGEGMISLARGFFIAGAHNVVMTQWAIADKTSNKLMQRFYTHLSNNENISSALRKSKIDYLKECDAITAHPYFWAGYVDAGNPSIVFKPAQKRIYLFIYAIGAVVFILLILLYRKKKSGKALP